MKKITKDIIIAVCLITYVLILALAFTRMSMDRLSKDIEIFSGVFLVLGLLGLEKAYKFDDGKIAITAIELLVMSFYSLSINHILALIKWDFNKYMFASAGVIGGYYLIKEILIFTKQRKNDLKNLSDISEIVKKDDPVKKEAKKRKKDEDYNNKKSKSMNNYSKVQNKNKAKIKKENIENKVTKKTTIKKENTKKEKNKNTRKDSKEPKKKETKKEVKNND